MPASTTPSQRKTTYTDPTRSPRATGMVKSMVFIASAAHTPMRQRRSDERGASTLRAGPRRYPKRSTSITHAGGSPS